MKISMSLSDFISKYSVNIGTVFGVSGSLLVAFNADAKSFLATGIYMLAELILLRFGHKTAGYALGAFIIGVGNIALSQSSVVPDGSGLQISLYIMKAAWFVGTLKWPLEHIAKRRRDPVIQKKADLCPEICGLTNLVLRIPGIITAIAAASYINAWVFILWGIADIMQGRLQERALKLFKALMPS